MAQNPHHELFYFKKFSFASFSFRSINHAPYPTQVTVQVTPQVEWKPPPYAHSRDGHFATVCELTSTISQRWREVVVEAAATVVFTLPNTIPRAGW